MEPVTPSGPLLGYGALIAPTAIVAPTAVIGYGAVVAAGAVVGEDVVIGACAYVGDGSSVGDDAYVGPGAIVGDNAIVRPGAAVASHGVVRAGAVVRAAETAGVRELDETAEHDLEWEQCHYGPRVPVVHLLDTKVLAAIEAARAAGARGLRMEHWHTCATVHCRAGWATTLAGVEGAALEELVGTATAGGLIYRASTAMLPDFYATDEDALLDVRRCADREASMWGSRAE